MALMGWTAFADDVIVGVAVETVVGGEVTRIVEAEHVAGTVYAYTAPAVGGAIFTHWTISTDQAFAARDVFGRAFDAVSAKIYEDTVLQAHYVVADLDADGDGLADGVELYWYGSTDASPSSDTDGDGATFAEELAAGTNPHLVETQGEGRILRGMTPLNLYNPHAYRPYVIRSNPEGSLFETETVYLEPGSNVATAALSPLTSAFAYWTGNGEGRRDALGRACDSVAFTTGEELVIEAVSAEDAEVRAKLYWYGREDIAMDSDTDGDGKTFAEEVAAGTNPLLAEEMRMGGVIRGAGARTRVDLQAFEQVGGFTVGGENAAIGGVGAVWPVVADVNGDGLFDVIVAHEGGARVYVNVGAKGAPAFEERAASAAAGVDLAMNSTAKLAGMSLDVAPSGALSATVWGETLLVSDSQGRIWYYLNFTLQHKVWGGTYAGFAEGLRLAAVDWDDDGDLDCLCGTADGRVFLLRDPNVGRPTGLVAEAGVESVNLSWNASAQSRVRGYRVYRSGENATGEAELPNYRDMPEREGEYAYRVTALSRYYVAGNSEPRIVESEPSEAASVDFGTAQFSWRLAEDGGTVNAQLIVRNSSGLRGELQLRVGYNPAVLAPKESPFVAGALAPAFAPAVTPSGADALIVSGPLGAVAPDQRGVLFALAFAKVAGGDLAAANLTAGEFAIESEGHATKIELGETTDGGSGDVNLDGAVDQADVTALKAILKKTAADVGEQVFRNADVNGDGQLSALDVVALNRILKGEK